MNEPRTRPWAPSWANHAASETSVFRPGRFFTRKPTDWNAELSTMSLALTLGQAKVSLSDVEFAVLERDTAKIEELTTKFVSVVTKGFTDAPDQQFAWQKGLTLPQRAFEWHHAQLYNIGDVIRKIHDLSPAAERLTEHEGMAGILARLGTAAGQMDAAYDHLKEWLDAHIDDQPK